MAGQTDSVGAVERNAEVAIPVATKRYVFVLVPEYPMVPLATAVEPLRMANRVSGNPYYSWEFASIDGNPVIAANGMETNVQLSLGQLRQELNYSTRPYAVMICSGNNVETYENRSLSAFLRECQNRGIMIGGMSSGSYLMAAAKVLEGRKCVIHWEHLSGFTDRFENVQARSELYEIDDKFCSCAGGVATLDMMISLIRSEHGDQLANLVCEQVIADRVRVADQRQRLLIDPRDFRNDKITAVVKAMEANLAEPLSLNELASCSGISRRQIERLFMLHMNTSPARYYLELRLNRAREMLIHTGHPISEISISCGFASASHFSKCYRRLFGLLPTQQRAGA